MNITHTISLLELIWLWITIPGVSFSLFALGDTITDIGFLKRAVDFVEGGPRHILAKNHLISEIIRFIILLLLSGMGIAAMTIPTAAHNGDPGLISTIIVSSLIVVGILTSLSSILNFLARRRLIKVISRNPAYGTITAADVAEIAERKATEVVTKTAASTIAAALEEVRKANGQAGNSNKDRT